MEILLLWKYFAQLRNMSTKNIIINSKTIWTWSQTIWSNLLSQHPVLNGIVYDPFWRSKVQHVPTQKMYEIDFFFLVLPNRLLILTSWLSEHYDQKLRIPAKHVFGMFLQFSWPTTAFFKFIAMEIHIGGRS